MFFLFCFSCFLFIDTLTGGCLLWDSLGMYVHLGVHTCAKYNTKQTPTGGGGVYRGGVEIVRN